MPHHLPNPNPETDEAQAEAARIVRQNQLAAARFAFGHAALSPDTAIAAIEAGIMVPQPVQQQQARETAAEWGARMMAKRPARKPRPVREDTPGEKAIFAKVAESGRRYAEAQNAVRAELNITEAPALTGRYGRVA